MLRSIARINTIQHDGNTTTLKDAFRPQPGYPSLTPLGAPREPGWGRRPRWISSTTAKVAAANAWKHARAAAQRGSIYSMPPQAFIKDAEIHRRGIPTPMQWDSKDEQTIRAIQLRARREYYRKCSEWQANPIGPIPKPPTDPFNPNPNQNRASNNLPITAVNEFSRQNSTIHPPLPPYSTPRQTEAGSSSSGHSPSDTPFIATSLAELRNAPPTFDLRGDCTGIQGRPSR